MLRKLSLESLETRETPAVYTGPFGGTLAVNTGFSGVSSVTTLTGTGALGGTADGELAVNLRSGAVTGTATVVGPNGRTAAVELAAQLGDESYTGTTTVTGPNGGTRTNSSAVAVDPATGAVTVAGTITGPNGRSFDYARTFPS